MQFDILTLFPDLVHHYAGESILGRGQQKGLISVKAHNFRSWTLDKQRHVDEHPYGGGPGMVLQVEPIYRCLESLGLVNNGKKVKNKNTKIIIMDPAGKKFDQRMAEKFSKLDRLVFVTGRYEGFDERVYKFVDEKISVGDYVLAGGELPALSIVEAVSRLIPGVLGNKDSIKEETHTIGTEYPQYTRPENFMGMKVPKVLLSGDHKKIEEWRKKNSK
jgi:tRNA (guanine37-N1)-methyltransferase